MSQEEMGRRVLLVGAGCAALVLLGACESRGRDEREREPEPKKGAVLTAVTEVPLGGGVLTPDGVLVLQLQQGQFTAYSAVCPHQSYRVRPPDSNGIMTCTGHRSKFRAVDGVRVDGPALGNLTRIAIEISGSHIVRA